MKWYSIFIFQVLIGLISPAVKSQTVIVEGRLVGRENAPVVYKEYWAELRSDDSTLLEKRKVNAVGNFEFQLLFAHNYYVIVRNRDTVVWKLLLKNKMEKGVMHYPVQIEIPGSIKEKDVYEITIDKAGNKLYLKNGQPVTELTYLFETTRRDTSEIIKKQEGGHK